MAVIGSPFSSMTSPALGSSSGLQLQAQLLPIEHTLSPSVWLLALGATLHSRGHLAALTLVVCKPHS